MGLIRDAKLISKRDPAATGFWGVFFLYPGFHILISHRMAHFFYRIRLYFVARWISQIGRYFTGIEIHPGAKIGEGLFIDHGMGVVIGETSVIGNNCTLYHGCTLGGTGKDKGKRHPTLGDNVLVGAGAKILGPFKVGNNARIGANSVVLNEVPDDATVVGVPGRIISAKTKDAKISSIELDQTNTPDPISLELCRVLHRLKRIEKQLSISDPEMEEDEAEFIASTNKYKKLCSEDLIKILEDRNIENKDN